ncbi:MAG: FkbM family methyltransferase [Verrucomicrobiales bacterium]|nr:FkbM family methyltransferase [Verrucomicrobiales bacterium]
MKLAPRFVSFAQNMEDVMLFRALGHIEAGSYVDIGAAHPVYDSVTKAFYDRGWRGVNVEPSTQYVKLLQQERPEDQNISCAVSSESGQIEFWDVADTGNSTILPELGRKYLEEGWKVERRVVECRPLSAIVDKIVAAEVHFMKLDAEGAEKSILESEEFCDFRPWIIVVEATVPNSTKQNHKAWEGWLTSKNYRFAYFDGLNRFYVAEEHSELVEDFAYPPCFFDHFTTFNEQQLRANITALEEGWQATGKQLAALRELVEGLGISADLLEGKPKSTWESKMQGLDEHGEPIEREYSNKDLRDIINCKNAGMVEMAGANLELAQRLAEKGRIVRFMKKLFQRAMGRHARDSVELQRRASAHHLELRERIKIAEEFLLNQVQVDREC